MSRRSFGSRRISADCFINNLFPREMPATSIVPGELRRGMAFECVVDGSHRIASGVFHDSNQFYVCRVSRLAAFFSSGEEDGTVHVGEGAWLVNPVAHLEGGDAIRSRCSLRPFRSDEAFTRWLTSEVPPVVRDYFSHPSAGVISQLAGEEQQQRSTGLTCSRCGKIYARAGWLANHEAVCAGRTPENGIVDERAPPNVQAVSVSAQFIERRHLAGPQFPQEEVDATNSACPHCGRLYQYPSRLAAHILICCHGGTARRVPREKKFPCRRCGKSYVSEAYLRRHEERIHVPLTISPMLRNDEGCHRGASTMRQAVQQIFGPSPADFDDSLIDTAPAPPATNRDGPDITSGSAGEEQQQRSTGLTCSRCGKIYARAGWLVNHEAVCAGRTPENGIVDERAPPNVQAVSVSAQFIERRHLSGPQSPQEEGGPTTIEVATGPQELSQGELEEFVLRNFVTPGVRFEIQYTMTSDPAGDIWIQNGTFSHFQEGLDGSRVAVVTYPRIRGRGKVHELLMVSDEVRIVSLKLLR